MHLKKSFLVLTLSALFVINLHAQLTSTEGSSSPTSIGMVISTNDTETIWNAL